MPEHRRKFSPQFKAEAVQMVIETGKPVARSWEAEHRPLPGRGPLDDLEPV